MKLYFFLLGISIVKHNKDFKLLFVPNNSGTLSKWLGEPEESVRGVSRSDSVGKQVMSAN